MLDEGHPLTMETNMLKDIVLPPTLVRKLLTAAGVSGYVSPMRYQVVGFWELTFCTSAR
jgi:hypothetical protein